MGIDTQYQHKEEEFLGKTKVGQKIKYSAKMLHKYTCGVDRSSNISPDLKNMWFS